MQENTDTRPPLAAPIVMALVMVVACCWTVAGVPSWVPVIGEQSTSSGSSATEIHGTVQIKTVDAGRHSASGLAPGSSISASTREGQYVSGQFCDARPENGICALPFSLIGDFGDSIRISYNGVSRIYPGGEARWGLSLTE